MAGIKLALVPYRGMAPVVTDLVGGHVRSASSIRRRRGGDRGRADQGDRDHIGQALFPLPDVPTFVESGLPGFESNGWFGIVAPAGTPAT